MLWRRALIIGGLAFASVIGAPALSAQPVGEEDDGEIISESSDDSEPGFEVDGEGPDTGAGVVEAIPIPAIQYDVSALPPPVRRIREQIIEAASTGDVENMRPVFEANGEPPLLSFGEEAEPIEQLRSLAGDPEGREILAILIEVLDAGFVHVDVGTPEEMYVWPYYARYPLDKLTGPQMVELFKLLTAGDYEDMKIFGNYQFYRAGITPNGVWKYFVAGD